MKQTTFGKAISEGVLVLIVVAVAGALHRWAHMPDVLIAALAVWIFVEYKFDKMSERLDALEGAIESLKDSVEELASKFE
jgi:hypothetical protein